MSRGNFIGFVAVGVAYTVFSEWVNVQIFKYWSYNETMPLIPWTKVGITPVLQWITIPPVVILLMRHYFLLAGEGT